MAKTEVVTVRLERQPNRRAVERLREAYGRLQQAGRAVEADGNSQTVQEVDDEPDSSCVWAGLNPTARTRSHD